MAKTYKGWTRVERDATYKDSTRYYTYWYKEGYPKITDNCDGRTTCNKVYRYEVSLVPGKPYESWRYRTFSKLEDAILYAETGKYRWDI